MTKTLACTVLALALTAPAAHADTGAGGVAGSIGVGAEAQLSGLTGISANYDAGAFHVGAFFGLDDPGGPNNTAFDLGGRFFFHIHHTATADFSLGGSLGIGSKEAPDGAGGSTSTTAVILEPSFQIRWFVASNVALSFTGGFSIGLTDDDKDFSIGGDLAGVAGIHYYFTR